MSESLANELALLVAMTPMSGPLRTQYLGIIARVRRLEIFVDEVVADAQEDEMLRANAKGSVVFVDFLRGRV